ncbi:hypothetical protein [Proteus columbae]|uniref:hypothetical protein n=1 Tax=Proteus columbae TaxID=1987580 RepID=UPI00288B7CAA|nr:hypothetical protein [Proteus columbae]
MASINIPESFVKNIRIYMYRLDVNRDLTNELITRYAVGAKRAGYRLNSRSAALYVVATMKAHDVSDSLTAVDCRDTAELVANAYIKLIKLEESSASQINLIDILSTEAASLSTKKLGILGKMGVALDIFKEAVAKRNKAAALKSSPGKQIALAILKKVH